MNELFLKRCKIPPYKHQVEGIEKILENPYFFLADEMGAGKTLQTIVAAQVLHCQKKINRVLVICPATVRPVWFDPELGELKKHLWDSINSRIVEFHGKRREWRSNNFDEPPALTWVITNYDYVRDKERFELLSKFCTERTLLVLDESSAVKNSTAKQTKIVKKLRNECGRVLLLNGTPIANNPGDMFSQGNIMHPSILNCPSKIQFRARYAIMGGWMQKQIVGWNNLEDLQKRFAPYVIRRLKIDCLDLPEKMPPVAIPVALTPKTWAIYKEMRDEMIAWLDEQNVAVVQQAAVKAMRLVQICSGFLGGIETTAEPRESPDSDLADPPAFLSSLEGSGRSTVAQPVPRSGPSSAFEGQTAAAGGRPSWGAVDTDAKRGDVQEIGREKLNLLIEWFGNRLEEDPYFKILIWCRFRAELARFVATFATEFPTVHLGEIRGGQKREEREFALRLLDPRTAPKGPVAVFGTPASGSMGLNLTAAHTVLYTSNDHNLKTRLQSMDRVHRPGQRNVVSYFDFIATGPQGQKTVDHVILKALNSKEEIATWTTNAWVKALTEE